MVSTLQHRRVDIDDLTNTHRVFELVVLYRWLSLIPAALALSLQGNLARWIVAMLAAVLVNVLITLVPTRLNAVLRQRPWLLLSDLLFCAGLFQLTGGWATTYYLYAFGPLLAAAFFFQLRGALLAATGMAAFFVTIGLLNPGSGQDLPEIVAHTVGFFLIAGTFGYATTLMSRLQSSHADLTRAHRDLEVIHSLTVSLQSAADINEVEERVLSAVTDDLGFPRAVVALVDQHEQVITAWLGKSRNGEMLLAGAMPHPARVSLSAEAGLISQAILEGKPRLAVPNIAVPDERLNRSLNDGEYHIFPMLLRGHPVGVLLVAASEQTGASLDSLQAIASQAAVAVGTTMLCIDRAQRLAVQEERIRIARDIHDTLSQSLFGMGFALDACTKLLPDEPEQVKAELLTITQLAARARRQLRESIMDIWPSTMTADSFASDLRKYVSDSCRTAGLELQINVSGNFERLSARIRRELYRIAQEALSNVARHAAASHVEVGVQVSGQDVALAVRDNGRGFTVSTALAREHDREHFGLRSIQERVADLGGSVEFLSQPQAGSTVRVTLPSDSSSSHG